MGRGAVVPMHGRTHCPNGSDPIPCLTAGLDVAYYSTTTLTHAGAGLQNYTMQLDSTSNSSVFDVSGALARVQAGAYKLVGSLNMGQAFTVSASAPNDVTFAMTFPAFPLFTHGYIGHIIPYTVAEPAVIWTMQFVGAIVCDAATTMRLNIDIADGTARTFADLTLYIEKVRDYDWTF